MWNFLKEFAMVLRKCERKRKNMVLRIDHMIRKKGGSVTVCTRTSPRPFPIVKSDL